MKLLKIIEIMKINTSKEIINVLMTLEIIKKLQNNRLFFIRILDKNSRDGRERTLASVKNY